MVSKRVAFGEWAALTILLAAVYGVCVTYQFVWDDIMLVRDNPYFHQQFQWWTVFHEGFWKFAKLQSDLPYYRPLVTLAYWVQTRIWGFDPNFFHAFNLVVHWMSVLLLWSFCLRIKIGSWHRRAACAIFAIHPVQLSCVAYVACLGDLMSGFFSLIAILLWTCRQRSISFVAILFSFFAMLSKEAALLLPLAFFAYDVFLRDESERKIRWWAILPWIPYFVLRAWALGSTGGLTLGWSTVIANQGGYNTFAYLSRIFLPIPTSLDPVIPFPPYWLAYALAGLLFVFVPLGFVFFRKPSMRFFYVWFLSSTLIIANWLNQPIRFSDQLLYFSMVPMSLLLGSFFQDIKSRGLLLFGIVSIFTAIIVSERGNWKDEYNFWKNETKHRPENPAIVLSYILSYNEKFKPADACDRIEAALPVLKRNYRSDIEFLFLYNLAYCRSSLDPFTSENLLRKAIEIEPESDLALALLVHVLISQGKMDQADITSQTFIDRHPNLFSAWRTRGIVLAKSAKYKEALIALERARSIRSTDPEISNMIHDVQWLSGIQGDL